MKFLIINSIFIIYFVHTFLRYKKSLHMLQLNSYKNDRYLKWLNKNLKKALMLFYKSEPQKKPFVVTDRIKRLYITFTIIFFTLNILLNISTSILIPIIILVLINFGIYFVTIPINAINSIVENHINKGFYNKAKNKVKDMKNLKVVGITGSYGKTSTKYIINNILTQKYQTLMTPESYNTTMGVTKTINNDLKSIDQVFVCEMGAKNAGDIKEICDLVSPKFGIITSIGEQHLETFKTLENVKKTKFELADSIPDDGIVFLNYNDINIRNMNYKKKNIIKYGIMKEAQDNIEFDYWAENIILNEKGTTFDFCSKSGKNVRLSTKLLGTHNICNIVGASAIACEMNLNQNEISIGVKTLKPVPHRLEVKANPNGYIVIDDAYNSNPIGSKMALEVLNSFEGYKKLIITPGMIELGDKQELYNKQFGEYISNVCDFTILVGKNQTKPIQEGLKNKGYSNDKIYIASDLNDAIQKMDSIVKGDKCVILFENDLTDDYLE